VVPVEPFGSSREVRSASLVRQRGPDEPLPGLLVVLGCFGHDRPVELLSHKALWLGGTTDFHSRAPWHLDPHVALTLVVRLLDTLVGAKAKLHDEHVPHHAELFLAEVVRGPYYPSQSVRDEHVRASVNACHSRLTITTAAIRKPEARVRVMVRPLPSRVRFVAELLEELPLRRFE